MKPVFSEGTAQGARLDVTALVYVAFDIYVLFWGTMKVQLLAM